MSYIRSCKTCGRRISLRKMPHDQWVAFDPNSEAPHDCSVNERATAEKFRRSVPHHSRPNQEDPTSNSIKTLDPKKVRAAIKLAQQSNRSILIEYLKRGGLDPLIGDTLTTRTIDVYRYDGTYFWGYCHLREDVRQFRHDRVVKIDVLKDLFSVKEDMRRSLTQDQFSAPPYEVNLPAKRRASLTSTIGSIIGFIVLALFLLRTCH